MMDFKSSCNVRYGLTRNLNLNLNDCRRYRSVTRTVTVPVTRSLIIMMTESSLVRVLPAAARAESRVRGRTRAVPAAGSLIESVASPGDSDAWYAAGRSRSDRPRHWQAPQNS